MKPMSPAQAAAMGHKGGMLPAQGSAGVNNNAAYKISKPNTEDNPEEQSQRRISTVVDKPKEMTLQEILASLRSLKINELKEVHETSHGILQEYLEELQSMPMLKKTNSRKK